MENSQVIRLSAATVNQTPIDWVNNLANIKQAIEKAKQNHVNLLLLPELSICGYGCEDLFLSDWVWEKSIKKLLELLPFTSGIVSFPTKKY